VKYFKRFIFKFFCSFEDGMKIKRGFRHPKVKETSEQEEKYQEVTHLVFVVHGIAQKMYENGIVKNCEE